MIVDKLAVILNRMLNYVSLERDKREGSVIFDAVKPAAEEIANMQLEAAEVEKQSKVITATDKDLNEHVADMGIIRYDSTNGSVIIVAFSHYEYEGSTSNLTMLLSENDEFSTINYEEILTFIVGEKVTDLSITSIYPNCYYAKCATAGLLPSLDGVELQQRTPINGLSYAKIVKNANSGTNEEEDEHLRQRYIEESSYEGFGGNRSQYLRLIEENETLRSMKNVQMYTGSGGRVVISALDGNFLPFDSEILNIFREMLDPKMYTGSGAGLVPAGHRVIACSPMDFILDVKITNAIPKIGWTEETASSAFIEKIMDLVDSLQEKWSTHNEYYQYVNNSIALSDILTLMLDYMTGQLTVNGVDVDSLSGDMSFGSFIVEGTENDRRIENDIIVNAPVNAANFPRCSLENITIEWSV